MTWTEHTVSDWHTFVKHPTPISVSYSPASECESNCWDHRDRSPGCHHLLSASGGLPFLLEEQEQIWWGGDPQWDQVWFVEWQMCQQYSSSFSSKDPGSVNWFRFWELSLIRIIWKVKYCLDKICLIVGSTAIPHSASTTTVLKYSIDKVVTRNTTPVYIMQQKVQIHNFQKVLLRTI